MYKTAPSIKNLENITNTINILIIENTKENINKKSDNICPNLLDLLVRFNVNGYSSLYIFSFILLLISKTSRIININAETIGKPIGNINKLTFSCAVKLLIIAMRPHIVKITIDTEVIKVSL
ncbi:MAG: hypothetical protein K0R72_587 [Clostridia bacterium]|jgi:hypothetical protein|nr:hypothetical protein [Clostridia bacterium]